MNRAARVVMIVALGLWTGGLSAISFVVAPTAFSKAPSRQVAGQIVGATLRAFGKVELVLGAAALAASLWLYSRRPAGTRTGAVRTALLFLMLVIASSYVFWIYPEAAVTRMKLEGMPNDPLVKSHFDRIHRISVILVSVNILLGAGVLTCTAAAKSSDGS